MDNLKFRQFDKRLKEFMFFELNNGCVHITNSDIESFDKDRAGSPQEQFTGIQDRKGNELCEGDICKVAGMGLGVVEICKYNGTQFKTLDGCDVPVIECLAEDNDFEIVGNLHQNPELLEQNDE